MNKLNRFYLSQNISIDNALSMNQILHQIVNQIKEIVDFINNLELRANEYTDQEIIKLNDKLQAQLETLEQTLKTYTADSIDTYNVEIINPQLTEIRNTIDTINRTINERIDDEVGVLNRRISSVESTLNKKIDDTKEYLEELIKKGNQLVYSSISGRKIPIQDTLFEMGNALKQILSYNWNTINVLKNYTSGFNETLNNFNVTLNPYGLFTKGFKISDIPTDENNHKYVTFEYSCESQFDNLNIGDTIAVAFITSNSEISESSDSPTGPFYYTKIASNKVQINVNVGTKPYILVQLKANNENLFSDLSLVDIYSELSDTKITWDTLKAQMENTDIEIRPNWNGLVFDGVNGWNILASVGGLYDDETIINPLWNELPYKNNVYRNENSSFYNQIEN